MISEEEFALEEQRLGKRVHRHDGVWWVSAAPFYCKPVHEFRPFAPGGARPSPLWAPGGYSHQVNEEAQGNQYVDWMVLSGQELGQYSLAALPAKKRNKVRIGLRECTVEPLQPQDDVLHAMREINISQAERFQLAGYRRDFLPPEYYVRNSSRWARDMRALFAHLGHVFWGARVGERLVAYIDVLRVADSWIFGAVKSHSSWLRQRPVDALYHVVLQAAVSDAFCRRVVNGGPDPDRPTLDHFKESFLFRSVRVHYYSHSLVRSPFVRRLVKPLVAWYRRLRPR